MAASTVPSGVSTCAWAAGSTIEGGSVPENVGNDALRAAVSSIWVAYVRSWPSIVRSAEFSCSRYITTSPSTTAAVSARPATTVTRARTVPGSARRTRRRQPPGGALTRPVLAVMPGPG